MSTYLNLIEFIRGFASLERQARFDATSRKINAKLDAQQHETLVTQQQRITGELANNADALLSSGTARLESENEASFGRYQHARLNLAESANVSSAAYAADAVALTLRHNSQMQNLQAGASAALAAGMARGESMHAAGLRNRAPVGPVLITSEQANSYKLPKWVKHSTEDHRTPGPWADGYVFAESSTAQSFTLPSLPSNQISAAGLGAFTLEEMMKRGWGSQLEVATARNPINKVHMQLGLGSFSEPLTEVRLDTTKLAPLVNEMGSGLTKLSFGFSIYGATQSYANDKDGWDFGDGFRELGKLGTDAAATGPSLLRAGSALTRFSPVGAVYTAADLAVQMTPDYTIQYGNYAGETRSGWTKLLYMDSDQQQRVMNVSPEMYYELYIRKQPKY